MTDENSASYKVLRKSGDRNKQGKSVDFQVIQSKISKKELFELFNLIKTLPLDETDKEQDELEEFVQSGKDYRGEAISNNDLVFINSNAPIIGNWTGKADKINTVFGETPRYFFNLENGRIGELFCKSRVFKDVIQKLPIDEEVVIFKANNGRWAIKALRS